MLAEIQSVIGVDADLIPGSAGIFEVKKDGVAIFSKHKIGRFPREGEIAELLIKI